MFKVKFEVVHQGCMVNETSRAFPHIRIICAGGFVDGSSVEEIIVLEKASEADVRAVMRFLETPPRTQLAEILEQDAGMTFIRFVSNTLPEEFCSRLVAEYHGYPLSKEIQCGGLEIWEVGCFDRRQGEQLLSAIESVGEVKHKSITEARWRDLL